jgi:hypothetical protein
MILDDLKDLSIKITDKLVSEGLVKNCIDTDDEKEFNFQDCILEMLCKEFNIINE